MDLRDLGGQMVFGPARDLWSLLLLPSVAALAGSACVRRPAETQSASRIQFALVAGPGTVSLVLCLYAIADTGSADRFFKVSAVWLAAPTIAVLLLAYAAYRMVRRIRLLRRLHAVSRPAAGRLARIADEVGVPVRELAGSTCTCFVAAASPPSAFLSPDVPTMLTDGELRAALSHELAHLRGRDLNRLLVLACLSDLVPWVSGGALRRYVAGLDRLADEAALASCSRADLASAILQLRRGTRYPSGMLAVADPAHLRWRLGRLLEVAPTPAGAPSLASRLALLVVVGCLAWPLVDALVHAVLCSG